MVNGNLCCGIVGAELMLRLGNAGVAAALARPRTRPMDFTGRVIRSMLFVEAKGVETTTELESWIALAADFASKLPEK